MPNNLCYLQLFDNFNAWVGNCRTIGKAFFFYYLKNRHKMQLCKVTKFIVQYYQNKCSCELSDNLVNCHAIQFIY